MSALSGIFVTHSFILQFLHYELLNTIRQVVHNSSVGSAVAYHEENTGLIPAYSFLFKLHVFHTRGGHYFNLIFPNFALFFFYFFLLSHSKTRGAQLVSQSERLKVHRHLTTMKVCTLSEQYGTYQTRVTGCRVP
jgi:hypothetical protein